MNARDSHCIVIGAGTVGACCAWHLVRAGFRVTLVDRAEPGQATSYGNAACISPSQVVPFSYPGVWKQIPRWLLDPMGPLTIRWRDLPAVGPWLWKFWRHGNAEGVRACSAAQARLMHRVKPDLAELLDGAGLNHLLRAKGLILLYDSRDDFEQDRWRHDVAESLGFGWDYLGPQELALMAPAIRLRDGVALHFSYWQHTVDPAGLTAAIAEAAMANGAEWVNDDVERVAAGDGRVEARLAGGRALVADRLVIAAGPWSNRLAAQLDHAVPMTPKRGYHCMIPDPGVELEYPVTSGSRSFVMTPLDGGLRVAGTAEFARLDAPPDYRRARVLLDHARRYLPDLRHDEFTEWMGQRPMMADSLPVISPSPSRPEVIYAFGHGHYGLTQGATTGRIVARLASGDDPGLNLAPYRFDRFRRP